MTEQTLLKAYKLIECSINNPKSFNRTIADEIYDRWLIDRGDLIQEVIVKFIEKENHPDIDNLSAYINTFTYYVLSNIRRSLSYQKRYDKNNEVSLDELLDSGGEIHCGKIILNN